MTRPAIEMETLTKRYGDTMAVSNLTTTVEAGSVYGFLGPNGAGKTTTMRMLTTLTRPTSGSATVAGHDVGDRESVTPHIGYLPEDPPVYDELTGREQLQYVAGLRDLPDAGAEERIEAMLDRFDLLSDADKRISDYSKGMRQKVGVIQAVLHEPAVAFLDEPTSGLDPRAARTMRDTISELADRDMTIFLSTHILPVVDELADTIGVLHDGELVAEGDPESLKSRAEAGEDATLEDAFLSVTQERTDAPAADTEGASAPSHTDCCDSCPPSARHTPVAGRETAAVARWVRNQSQQSVSVGPVAVEPPDRVRHREKRCRDPDQENDPRDDSDHAPRQGWFDGRKQREQQRQRLRDHRRGTVDVEGRSRSGREHDPPACTAETPSCSARRPSAWSRP